MQKHPDQLYQRELQRQAEIVRRAERERHAYLFPSRPWLDVAMWSAIVGPGIALGFLIYFARLIASTLGG